MDNVQPHERIFLAFDDETFEDRHKRMLDRVALFVGGVKIGITSFFTPMPNDDRISVGSAVRSRVRNYYPNLKIFIDGKFKDIDMQVAGAARGVAKSGAWGFTMHASNSPSALQAAVENASPSLAIGVTILTSMTDKDSFEIYGEKAASKVVKFARNFARAGGRAVVCSPLELPLLGGIPLIKITPGIRNQDSPPDEQRRTATARDAVRNGADFLVIGRPITGASDPAGAAQRFAEEIESGFAARSSW
ncbi:MAG TPA: orotidine-5'-phosphate decarboxylase [Candidatus Paceibacterota bacterium]|nr:orotidine-5'-phosphate decarboxylase [Candidatus Paceibacterota bacterium]